MNYMVVRGYMVSYKICYTAGTYNYLVDKTTSFFTTSVQSCDSLPCSKSNEYWDILTILLLTIRSNLRVFTLIILLKPKEIYPVT